MNQKCPSCGNYVEGKRPQSYTKKVAKTGVKSIVNGAASVGAASTGAAIGTAIFPGVGTAVGAAAGFVASAMFHTAVNEGIDKIVDITEENVTDIVYEFSCPKCGKKWTKKVNSLPQSHSSIQRNSLSRSSYTSSQTSRCDDIDFDWHNKFWEDYECYFDDLDEILSTKESVKDFINELASNMQDCEDYEIRGHYLFLVSFICLEYSIQNLNDNLFDLALSNIKLALSNNDNEEYRLLSTILHIAKSTPNEDYIFSALENLDIESVQSELTNTEYWKTVFEIILHSKIVIDFLPFYQKTNDYTNLLRLLFAYNFEDTGYRISICNMISDAYEELGDYSKQFGYVKTAVELADFENEFDPNDPDHSYWLIALENLGICYEEGQGVEKDVAKAFEIYTRCANLGSELAMSCLGDMYENGVAVGQNYSVALDWYNKALAAGYDEVEEDIKRILEKLGIEKQQSGIYIPKNNDVIVPSVSSELTDDEQSYVEELKVCFEEDGDISPKERRLLERFREKLGISAERAKELEEKLLTPQLTDAEQEYLEEYKACTEENGDISPKERRLLNRLRDTLGISEERASELEKL